METLSNLVVEKRKAQTAFGARPTREACVVLASGLWLLTSGAHAQDAQTLLAQMKTAEATISYSATKSSAGGTKAHVFRSGSKQRIEWLSPSVRAGDFQLDDGQNVYLYHRTDKSVTKTDSRAHAPSFVASGVATPTNFAGRRAFAIPIPNGRKIFVDAATKVLLGIQGGANNFTLTQVKFGAVPAAKFRFVAPAGATVSSFPGSIYSNVNGARRAASWLQVPAKLPAGWSFESAVVGSTSAWLRFSNGQNRISLFEQRTGDADYQVQGVDGGGKFWRKGGVRFLATGTPTSAIDTVVDGLK